MPYCYFYGRVSHRDSAASGVSPDLQIHSFRQWFQYEKNCGRLPDHEIGPTGWQGGPDVDEHGIVRRDNQGIRKRIDMDRDDGVYIDLALSAYRTKFLERPAGVRLNLVLKPGDIVWFYNINRGFRNAGDAASIMENWNGRGINLVFHGANIDTRTALGRAMFQLVAVFSELDSSMKSEQQLELKARRKQTGKPINGHRQMGFTENGMVNLPEREVMKGIVRARHHKHPKITTWQEISDTIEIEAARLEGRPRRFFNSRPTPLYWTPERCQAAYAQTLDRGWIELPPGVERCDTGKPRRRREKS
jgi:DNA invertase Pin-like site-specific DNA recombinase